jgi:mRNA interferase MazF
MPTSQTIKRGEIYWCEPDPSDTVGSEIEKDRPWIIVSVEHLHRGNCVVGIPVSRQDNKALAHLIKTPKGLFKTEAGVTAFDGVALTDQIRCLDKRRLRKKFGTITDEGLDGVLLGLQRYLGI